VIINTKNNNIKNKIINISSNNMKNKINRSKNINKIKYINKEMKNINLINNNNNNNTIIFNKIKILIINSNSSNNNKYVGEYQCSNIIILIWKCIICIQIIMITLIKFIANIFYKHIMH